MRFPLVLSTLLVLISACSPAGPSPPNYTMPPAPVVTAVSPTTGSTEGGTNIRIEGTNMDAPIVMVTIGTQTTRATRFDGALWVVAGPHAAGAVDVRVDVNTQIGVLPGGFTFAPPGTFDFNGDWSGVSFAGDDGQDGLTLKVEADVVTSFSCGTSGPLALSPAPAIIGGKFSFSGNGMTITGRLVDAASALGAVDMPACPAMSWWATKRQ